MGAGKARAASSVGVGRRVKRETALVSYNDLKARHSVDGVILLVGLRSYDAYLSVTFLSDMQRTPKLCYNREFKQIATAGADTAAGSKFSQK